MFETDDVIILVDWFTIIAFVAVTAEVGRYAVTEDGINIVLDLLVGISSVFVDLGTQVVGIALDEDVFLVSFGTFGISRGFIHL